MPPAFSNDLKWRIVYLHYDGFSTTQIAQMLYMSKYTVKKVLKIHRKWGCVVDPWLKKAGKKVSVPTLWRSLHFCGITRKKVK